MSCFEQTSSRVQSEGTLKADKGIMEHLVSHLCPLRRKKDEVIVLKKGWSHGVIEWVQMMQ